MSNRVQFKPGDFSLGQIHEFLGAYGRKGGTPDLLQQAIEDKALMDRVMRVWKRVGTGPSVARCIFGAEHWLDFYSDLGISFSKAQLTEASQFPWGWQVLEEPDPWEKDRLIKETHFAFLGVKNFRNKSLNLSRAHQIHPGLEHLKVWSKWWREHPFAQNTCEFRWYLMRIGIVPESRNLSYRQQVIMLSDSYEVPLVIERVTANILFYQNNGAYFDQDYWARCRDKTDQDLHIHVRGIPGFVLESSIGTNHADALTGVAASRKIPN